MDRKGSAKRLKKEQLDNCPYTSNPAKKDNADAILGALDGYATVWRDFVRLVMTDEKIPMPRIDRQKWHLYPPRALSWTSIRACIVYPFKDICVLVGRNCKRTEDAYEAYKAVKQELEKG